MADIVIEDLTDGSLDANNDWIGEGVFDKLIMAVNKNIEGQYLKDRIKGTDYANVYLGSMQSVIAQSMQYILQEKLIEAQIANAEKDLDIKERQTVIAERKQTESEATSAKNREVLEAQKALYERQREGLDDDKHQKILHSALGAWGMAYQDAGESMNIPAHLVSSVSGAHIGLEKLFDNAMGNVRDSSVAEPAVVA